MHPVIQDGVLAQRVETEEKDREQDPSDRVAGAAGRQQGADNCHGHYSRRGAQPVGCRPAGAILMDKSVERHSGQAEPEREHAEPDRHDGCRRPGSQDRARHAAASREDPNEPTLGAGRSGTVTGLRLMRARVGRARIRLVAA